MPIHPKMITKRWVMAGKGDKPRPGTYSQEYRDNFDKIFGKKKPNKEQKNETDSKRKR